MFKTSTVDKIFIIMDDLVAQRYRAEQIRPDDDWRKKSVSQLAKQTMSNFLFLIDCNEASMAVL